MHKSVKTFQTVKPEWQPEWHLLTICSFQKGLKKIAVSSIVNHFQGSEVTLAQFSLLKWLLEERRHIKLKRRLTHGSF